MPRLRLVCLLLLGFAAILAGAEDVAARFIFDGFSKAPTFTPPPGCVPTAHAYGVVAECAKELAPGRSFTVSTDTSVGAGGSAHEFLEDKIMEIRQWWLSQDYSEAMKWLRKAADKGNPLAQSNLGEMYYKGWGVPQDYAEAAKWYLKAAAQGEVYAQNNIAGMYDNGEGLPLDDVEAVKWYRKAAEQGYDEAQVNLGVSYNNGEGVTQNYAEAAKWHRRAAEQGNAQGQYYLAGMYYSGQGVQKDLVQAYKWFGLAASTGCNRGEACGRHRSGLVQSLVRLCGVACAGGGMPRRRKAAADMRIESEATRRRTVIRRPASR
jgi:Sel1 repeat